MRNTTLTIIHHHISKYIASIILLLISTIAHANESITLYYHERPPYAKTLSDGSITGLTATPAISAFKAANIPFAIKKIPSNRQYRIIERNEEKACALGWFKNSDRSQLGKFTKPLYQDKPTVVLTLNTHNTIKQHTTLKELLADKSLHLLVKDGYSYGEYIDDLIVTSNTKKIAVTVENVEMLNMLSKKRADYMFIDEEEINELINLPTFQGIAFKIIHLSDSPAGNTRYLWCTHKVSDENLNKLNSVIKPIP